MFLPIPSSKAAALLAISVSLTYVIYFIHFMAFNEHNVAKYVHGLDIVSIDFSLPGLQYDGNILQNHERHHGALVVLGPIPVHHGGDLATPSSPSRILAAG